MFKYEQTQMTIQQQKTIQHQNCQKNLVFPGKPNHRPGKAVWTGAEKGQVNSNQVP